MGKLLKKKFGGREGGYRNRLIQMGTVSANLNSCDCGCLLFNILSNQNENLHIIFVSSE